MNVLKNNDYVFAQRLKKIMVEKNLSYGQMQTITGINRERIHDYVNGKHIPTIQTIIKISKSFNISPLYFIDEKLYIKKEDEQKDE